MALELGIPSWTHLDIFGPSGLCSSIATCAQVRWQNKKVDFSFGATLEHRKGSGKKIKGLYPKKRKKCFLSLLFLEPLSLSLFSLSKTISIWYFYHLILLFVPYHPLSTIFSTIYRLMLICEQVKGSFGAIGRRPKLPTLFLFILWYSKVIF